jgi:hypothetical protein
MLPSSLGIVELWLFIRGCYISCPNCARKVFIDPAWQQEVSIGPRLKECYCGLRFGTGQREWDDLTAKQKRSYLLGENASFMSVICAFFGVLGYFARWNDDRWMTAFVFVLFGLFCCIVVLMFTVPIRLNRIYQSKRRTRRATA